MTGRASSRFWWVICIGSLYVCAHTAQAQTVTIRGGHYWGAPIIGEIQDVFGQKRSDIQVVTKRVRDWKPWKPLRDGEGIVLVHYRRLVNVPQLRRKKGIDEYIVGRSGVIVVTNRANPVKSLTIAHIRRLLSAKGARTTWKAFGGTETPTACVTGPRGAQAWHILRRQCMLLDDDYSGRFLDFRSDLRMKREPSEIVKAVKKNVNAVGFVLWQDGCERLLRGVKVLPIGRRSRAAPIAPDLREGIQADYALSEEIVLLAAPNAPDGAREFCSFACGPEGAAIAAKNGLTTLRQEREREAKQRLKVARSGKGLHVRSAGPQLARSSISDLATEYTRAKAAVQLSYATVKSEVAGVGSFTSSFEIRRYGHTKRVFIVHPDGFPELLILDGKPSAKALEKYGEKWNELMPEKLVMAGRAVAIIVNRANKTKSLTLDQVRAVFDATTNNWATVGSTGLTTGGRGAAIRRFGLPSTDPATAIFHKNGLAAAKIQRVTKKKDTAAVVAAVSMDANAIGFVDLAAIPTTGQTVKVLPIQLGLGDRARIIAPSAQNIRTAMYPLSKRMYVYVHPRASKTAKDFAKFIATCGGSEATPYADTVKAMMDVYRKHGLIPLGEGAIDRIAKDAAAARAKAAAAKLKREARK
jgi:ABC-type phosphate transport system substrate-binding protein